ncbi:MAG: RNA polymerase sigma factor [Verrucomicrobiota bacterium]
MPDSVSSIIFNESGTGIQQSLTDAFNEDTDRTLFHEVRKGDSLAFRELFSRYETRLVAYAEKYLDSTDLARDVVQDVFLKLIHKPPRMMLSDSLAPWLFRVTRNLAIDRRRSRKYEVNEENAGIHDMSEEQGPFEQSCTQSEYELLRNLVEQLPQPLKDVVYLRMNGEVPFREIATILSIPQGTALWRMHRAVKLLREQWNEHVEQV